MSAASQTANCASCGAAQTGESALCSVCGTSLLVDVVVQSGRAVDSRAAFQAGRALAALGPPAPDFPTARRRLTTPGEAVVRNVSKAFAARAIEVLATSEIAATMRATTGASPRRPPVLVAGAIGAVVVIIALAAFFMR